VTQTPALVNGIEEPLVTENSVINTLGHENSTIIKTLTNISVTESTLSTVLGITNTSTTLHQPDFSITGKILIIFVKK